MRTGNAWLICAIVSLSLVACTPTSESTNESSAPYERPGWMAAQAQADEELVAHQKSCLQVAGYTFTVASDGRFEPSTGTDMAAFADALRDCTSEALGDAYGWSPTADELEALYARQLDVVACLENEGYSIDGIPTKDSYVDAGGSWTPYDGLAIDGDTQIELKRACPDPGAASL